MHADDQQLEIEHAILVRQLAPIIDTINEWNATHDSTEQIALVHADMIDWPPLNAQ